MATRDRPVDWRTSEKAAAHSTDLVLAGFEQIASNVN